MGQIAALLCGLADLAERAAGRCHAVRWLVLWALWRADAVARDFVADTACGMAARHWSPAVPAVRYGHAPDDARALALSLRALARALQTLAALARHLSRRPGAAGGSRAAALRRLETGLARLAAAVARVVPHDTS